MPPREIKSPLQMFNRESKQDGVVDWRPNPLPSGTPEQSKAEAPDPKGSSVLASAVSSDQIAALQEKHFGRQEETLADLDLSSQPDPPETTAPAGKDSTLPKVPAFSTRTS